MTSRRPLNFIFLQPDEMLAESPACYGHPLIRTPNYDRLAAQGVCRATLIRSLRHKRIRRTQGQDEQDDPRETRNLIDDSGVRIVRADLERPMLDWFIRTSDTVPRGGDPGNFPSTPHLGGCPVTEDRSPV